MYVYIHISRQFLTKVKFHNIQTQKMVYEGVVTKQRWQKVAYHHIEPFIELQYSVPITQL